MAKRGGVSAEDYKAYDAGTTIFTREQNLDAFAPGSTPANLDHQAEADRRLPGRPPGWSTRQPPLDGLLEPKFVEAVTSG